MRNALSIILFVFASNVTAATITLDAGNTGWYNSTFSSNGGTASILSGDVSGTKYRNWIAFDLSTITDTILSASLAIDNHIENDSGLTFTWHEITTSFTELSTISGDLFGNNDVYTDLKDGAEYATGTTSAGSIDNYTFNSTALTSLNSSTGFWSTGGSTLDDLGLAYGFTDGIATNDFIQLTLTFADPPVAVPVPAATLLFGSGLLALFGFAKRKRG